MARLILALWLGFGAELARPGCSAAASEDALAPKAVLLPSTRLPDGPVCPGPVAVPRWAFALPAVVGPAERSAGEGTGAAGCDPKGWHLLPGTAAEEYLPRPLWERAIYYGLRQDGSTMAVQVIGVAGAGERRRLLCGPVEPAGATRSPAAGDLPDGGVSTPDGGVALAPSAPAPAEASGEGDLPMVALLLQPAATTPAPVPPDPAKISGVVRRRVGRQSLLAHGAFTGAGLSWAAVFKRRAESINLAIFGDDGNLRLYQMVPWPKGVRARPLSIFPVVGLAGLGHDGLLVVGAVGDTIPAAPVFMVLQINDHTIRVYSPE